MSLKKVKLAILLGVLLFSMGCAGGEAPSGSSDATPSDVSKTESVSEPVEPAPAEPAQPLVLPGGQLSALEWGFPDLSGIPGAVRIATGEEIQRYCCGNFLDDDTLVFATNYMRGSRFALFEYKISEGAMRLGYDNPMKILGGSFPFVGQLDPASLVVSTRTNSMRFSLPDYQPISDLEPPVDGNDIYASKTEEYDPLALHEDQMDTPEWGYGYYYDGDKVFIPFGGTFSGGESEKLEFIFGEEGKPPTVIEIPGERFPQLPPPPEGKVYAMDLREGQYAPDKPYFVARIKLNSWGVGGVESLGALLVCNYETGAYYLSEFTHAISTINIPVFNQDQSKVLIMADVFTTSRDTAYMTTYVLDIEALLRHNEGEMTK